CFNFISVQSYEYICVVLRCWFVVGVVSSISVTGYSGGGVNITCRYDRKYTDNAKYFCRGQWKTTCSDVIRTDMKNENKWVDSGRFSLFDYTRAALFTVTFRNLSEQDSGMYWCAADISWGKDSYTEVKLKVVTDLSETTSPPSSSSSSSSSSPPSSSPPSSSSSSPPSSSSSSPPPSSSSSSSFSLVRAPLITGVYITGCDYEEIKDTHKQLPTNPSDSSNAVYATAQLPTNPSDSSNAVYATAQLPTNPSDSSNTVYATAQLPTNPSDSSVYSTVQEASGDSQIFITSAEDLNYAVVNFQKKADCPDRVSLRNNQDYSEYAAVNHLTA
uniref:Immunoglobulin domain-containing protein n=1 Tax=Cyprinus carpio TaxID=7962 RepID=A0A8C1LGF8_CYPCA